MQNYFNYFTEIEERFQQRRGSLLMLSTLDWALIETWREAGIPLEAVLRGIDDAFAKHDAKLARAGARRVRKVNGLAWVAQSVVEAMEQTVEAATGLAIQGAAEEARSGFESERVARYLAANADKIDAATLAAEANAIAIETAARLRTIARELTEPGSAAPGLETGAPALETLDRTLTVLEERLMAALVTAAPEQEMVSLREQAARELAPYRGKMQAAQIRQVEQQFLRKRLLEARGLPRLSLFYMSHD